MTCAQCDREDRQNDLPTMLPPQTFEPCGHLRPYKPEGTPSAVKTILLILLAIAGAWMLSACQRAPMLPASSAPPICTATGNGTTMICIDGNGNTVYVNPLPTPVPSATPAVCLAEAIVASLAGGSQLAEITVSEEPKRLDATAFNATGEVPSSCNLTRFPVWEERTPSVCKVIGTGWNPHLDGIKAGTCEVRACLKQAGNGTCFAAPLAGETSPATSPVLSVVVR